MSTCLTFSSVPSLRLILSSNKYLVIVKDPTSGGPSCCNGLPRPVITPLGHVCWLSYCLFAFRNKKWNGLPFYLPNTVLPYLLFTVKKKEHLPQQISRFRRKVSSPYSYTLSKDSVLCRHTIILNTGTWDRNPDDYLYPSSLNQLVKSEKESNVDNWPGLLKKFGHFNYCFLEVENGGN